MKNALIIGASGFVGSELFKAFSSDTAWGTFGTCSKRKMDGLKYLNVTDLQSIKTVFAESQSDTVIIAASLTNVEYCEKNREEAYKINVSGIENLVNVCKRYHCRVIFISTEYVFDGLNGPYDEKAKVNPINYYGETKLLGERIIQKELMDYLIVRTTVVYGWDLQSKNFIMQLIRNLGDNKVMKVPVDQVSCPTYCPNLAEMIKECCDKNIKGIINLVGPDILDRFTFAVKVAEQLNLNKDFLQGIETKMLGQLAPRPLKAGLKIDKALSLLDIRPKGIFESLDEINQFYSQA